MQFSSLPAPTATPSVTPSIPRSSASTVAHRPSTVAAPDRRSVPKTMPLPADAVAATARDIISTCRLSPPPGSLPPGSPRTAASILPWPLAPPPRPPSPSTATSMSLVSSASRSVPDVDRGVSSSSSSSLSGAHRDDGEPSIASKPASGLVAVAAVAVDRKTHANLARCYLDTNAADALDETVAQVSGNVRMVARRALRRDELVYRGSPLMHLHSSDPKTVLLFVGELPDDLTRRLDAVTKNLYPTNDTQTAGFVRRHVLPYFFGTPDRLDASLPAALGVPASRATPTPPPTELELDAADVPFVDAWRRTGRLQIRLAARLLYNGLCSNMGESESTVDADDDGDARSGDADRKMKSSSPPAAAASDKKRHESWRWAKNWYLGASKFNHSCHPNCMLVQGSNNALAIHTTCEIGEGEELTLPYWFVRGELFFGASDARRQDFIRAVAYAGFDCKCYICRAQAGGGAAKTAGGRKVPRPVDYLINLPDPDLYPQLRRRGPWCANCGKQCIGVGGASASESKGDSALWCRACLAVVYCGAECQREHWRDAHRSACARTYFKRAQMRPLVLKFVTRQSMTPSPAAPPLPPLLLESDLSQTLSPSSSSSSSPVTTLAPPTQPDRSTGAPVDLGPLEVAATSTAAAAATRGPTLLSPWGLAIEPPVADAPPEDGDGGADDTEEAKSGLVPIDFNEPPSDPPPVAAFTPPPFPVSATTFSVPSPFLSPASSPSTTTFSGPPAPRTGLRRPHSTSTPRSRPSPLESKKKSTSTTTTAETATPRFVQKNSELTSALGPSSSVTSERTSPR